MSNPELQAARGLAKLVGKPVTRYFDRRKIEANFSASLQAAGQGAGPAFLTELDDGAIEGLRDYLLSPDAANVAHQIYLARSLEHKGRDPQELLAACREQVRLGLRHRTGLREGLLFEASEAAYDTLLSATHDAWAELGGAGVLPSMIDFTLAGRVTAAAIRNAEVLRSIEKVSSFHRFETELRGQLTEAHGEMRLPHAGSSRSVPYAELYIEPHLSRLRRDVHGRQHGLDAYPPAGEFIDISDVLAQGGQLVVLGAPGAGKSTLAAKLTHDLAAEGGLLPFLVIMRELADGFEKGGRTVVEYIEDICRDPYNVAPPPGAVEYAFLNGRAMVVFDGFDELNDSSLRAKVARLIESFVTRYPLVPVLVTSREVGYEAAPLNPGWFDVAYLADFDPGQVRSYAERWFNLDDAAAQGDRAKLGQSFIRDSEEVRDLRRSPLMLSLLCGMYSTERYIPRNRPDVYEKCANMLFERWDKMRGIDGAAPFAAQIRSAVQHLAWHLFTNKRLGGSMPRRKIITELSTNFFAKRHRDEDSARDEAERFLDFCTGRAWVLADVGTTDAEPRYGFTHRTFLEYFAAEHLVRTRDSSPARVFNAVARRLEKSEWTTLCELSLQILERNVSDGGDRFLSAVVRHAAKLGPSANGELMKFVSSSVQYVALTAGTGRSALRTMIQHECARRDDERYWSAIEDWPTGLSAHAREPFTMLTEAGGENARILGECLVAECRGLLLGGDSAGVDAAVFLLHATLSSKVEQVKQPILRSGLLDDVKVAAKRAEHPEMAYYEVLGSVSSGAVSAVLAGALSRYGAVVLYATPVAPDGHSSYTSISELLILNEWASELTTSSSIELIADVLPALPTPWVRPASVNDSSLVVTHGATVHKNLDESPVLRRAVTLALLTPYVELLNDELDKSLQGQKHFRALSAARRNSNPDMLAGALRGLDDHNPLASFLREWAAGRTDTTG
ncbi:NACHT domain-containing protein [Nucisporomicrobium flavum]|uniref:NACHT domain-containing protein n=1 Tax=Nucisporomicrobium flavum TaxID=2785915 RepID=UPI003C2E1FC5